jgi:hypothetical protein
MMVTIDELRAALERVARQEGTAGDLQLLRLALARGEITAATGERAVAIGDDASDLTIITGNGNVVFKGVDTHALREALGVSAFSYWSGRPASLGVYSMPDRVLHPLDIFISSPSDVSEERELALKVIEQLNERPNIQEEYVLKPLAWERTVPAAVGETPQRIVDRYMLEAGKADIFICFLWARMGTPTLDQETGEEFDSGTEYEFTAAYRAYQKTRTANYPGRPQILLYRCIRPIPYDVDPEQLKKV